MQTELYYFKEPCLGKKVRDYNYKQVKDKSSTERQRGVIETIIQQHPEGITDLEICILTGISRSSVTARRNEIPDIIPIGVAKIVDEQGDRFNTLWGRGDPLVSCGTQKRGDEENDEKGFYMD